MQSDGPDCVSIQLDLPKQAVGWIWPVGQRLPTSVLEYYDLILEFGSKKWLLSVAE